MSETVVSRRQGNLVRTMVSLELNLEGDRMQMNKKSTEGLG